MIYLVDAGDDQFSDAFNVTAPQCSEWKYVPFERRAA